MPITTVGIGAAVAPAVIKTYVSHYTNRKPRRQKPTAHISYDEGLNLVRAFLEYASHHTVEDFQSFTAQWVPSPSWIRTEDVPIPTAHITKAADAIIAQLGEDGIQQVGGRQWWQWRRKAAELKGEWIEMRADYNKQKQLGRKSSRIMLYVHGGAYFFGSVDEHRYQMQRHARKLKARVFAPRYRLSPQFPFPCGLHDCLAAYLYLLSLHDNTEIVLAGDSAGGGMVVSILCMLRDQGLPMPAGAILISPWVDLTHSFPSVAGENEFDYIPAHGFMQKPSASWPPPNDDDMEAIRKGAGKGLVRHKLEKPEVQKMRAQGFTEHEIVEDHATVESAVTGVAPEPRSPNKHTEGSVPGPSKLLSIEVDGKMVELRDQIQMYATNQLISHPLVSPVLQPSLGGLCPLLILTGGGEVLRDEQIYLAHKAAHPAKYPLGAEYRARYDPEDKLLNMFKPTPVQLQVWEDLCHVAPTLSFTRPAKFMYRSIAQFGAWALARAQNIGIDVEDEDISDISNTDSEYEQPRDSIDKEKVVSMKENRVAGAVGKAGDSLPPFTNHMIRQGVDRHGRTYPLGPASSLPALQLAVDEIGIIKVGPVKKWMDAKFFWDNKYAKNKRRIQQKRIRYLAKNRSTTFGDGETPPPSALAGRQHEESSMVSNKLKKSFGLAMWSGWGSKHDEDTIKRENRDAVYDDGDDEQLDGGVAAIPKIQEPRSMSRSRAASTSKKPSAGSRSRSARRTTLVRDEGQVEAAQAAVQPTSETVTTANPAEAPQAVTETVQVVSSGDYLTPMFLPQYKTAPHLRSESRDLPEARSVATDGTKFDNNMNDNASTMAVFAASGISKDHAGRPASKEVTGGGLTTSRPASVAGNKVMLPDNAGISRPHTSSGNALGGYDTPGSRRSIERLVSHQVDINGAGQEGELASLMSQPTEHNATNMLTVNGGNMYGLRSPSSTAMVQSEGVVGYFETEDKVTGKEKVRKGEQLEDVVDLGVTDSGLISDATKIGTANAVTVAGSAHASERPGMYERQGTIFRTALERL